MVKKKNRTVRALFYSLLFFIVYFLLFPYETRKETVIRPYRVHRLDAYQSGPETVQDSAANGEVYSFRLGDTFGYLDKNGNITYKNNVLYNVAITDRGFINYSSIQDENQTLVLSDTSGNFKQNFSIPGYPFFSDNGNRLFIIKTDATGISEADMNTGKSWRADFASIITGFASNNDYAAVGLLNGQLKVYNTSGDCVYTYTPEKAGSQGSNIPVVYSCAFSSGSDTFASVSGVKPRQLLVFRRGNKNYGSPVRKDLPSEVRRAVYFSYSAADRFLVSEGSDGFYVTDMKTLQITELPVKGRIVSADMHREHQLFAFSSYLNDDNKTDMYLVSLKNGIVLKNSSPVKIGFIRFAGDSLIIGFDNILMVCSVSEV